MIVARTWKVESKVPGSPPDGKPQKQFSGKSPRKVRVVGLSHQTEKDLEITSYSPWADILNIELLCKKCILLFTPPHLKKNFYTCGELPAQLFIWNSMILVWSDVHTALSLSGNVAELDIFLFKLIWDLQSRFFHVSWDGSAFQLMLLQHHVQSTFCQKFRVFTDTKAHKRLDSFDLF